MRCGGAGAVVAVDVVGVVGVVGDARARATATT